MTLQIVHSTLKIDSKSVPCFGCLHPSEELCSEDPHYNQALPDHLQGSALPSSLFITPALAGLVKLVLKG